MTEMRYGLWNNDERRRSIRFEIDILVFWPSGQYEVCEGTLSTTGCHFVTSERPDVGTDIDLELRLPGIDRGLHVRSPVARLLSVGDRFGVVVLFEDLPDLTKQIITRWLDHLATTFPTTSKFS